MKVLRPETAADARISGSFEREAQTLSSLKHPHIIDIVGFGTLDDGRQSMAIDAASSGVECDAVVQKIEQLARKFPKPK